MDEWLASKYEGEWLVGSHPLLTRETFYPDADDAFLGYGITPDGAVMPGSY